MADDAGALLVRSGLITADALELARALVQSAGGSLGEHLVATNALSDDALTEFYRTRLLVPQVNPNTLARLPESVVAAIPPELAIDMRVIPVALGEGITIAMGDPSNRVAVDEVSSATGTYVIRSVATQMQIAWCLAHYYGHVTALGQRLVQNGPTGEGGEPIPPPSAPPRRARGLTSKVNAARHRALPPITSQVQILRPNPALLDDPTPDPVIEISADEPSEPTVQIEAAPPGPDDDGGDDTEAEIQLEAEPAGPGESAPRLPSLAERLAAAHVFDDLDDDDDEAAPPPLPAGRVRTVTGEIAIGAKRKPTVRQPVEPAVEPESTIEISDDLKPKRRAANWQDPPELASRTGELAPRPASHRSHLEEPAIIIADDIANDAYAPPAAGDPVAEAKAKANRLAQLNASVEVKLEDDVAIVTSQPARHLTSGGASGGAVGQAADESDSAPILLQPKRPSLEMPAAGPPEPVQDEPSGVVLLAQPKRPSLEIPAVRPPAPGIPAPPVVAKPATKPAATKAASATSAPTSAPAPRRPEKKTQLGLGIDPVKSATSETVVPFAASPGSGRASRDTEVTLPPHMGDEEAPEEVVARLQAAASAAAVSAPTAAPALAANAAPAARPSQRAASRASTSDVDDGWGPPGSTIPPPWLGSIPGGIDADLASGIPGAVIPISDESGPLLLAPPSPPQPRRSGSMPAASTSEDLVAELEAATGRVVELVRRLDQAVDRDQIIDLLVQHLADSHQRAGFFTIRQAVLTPFRLVPGPAEMPAAQLKLDGPSTLQDVVDTQLPYRGPIADESSRQFLAAVLGEVPAEILLVPISVRERAVGVLFAERRKRHTFDEQLAVASRAAGAAFERVVRARRNG